MNKFEKALHSIVKAINEKHGLNFDVESITVEIMQEFLKCPRLMKLWTIGLSEKMIHAYGDLIENPKEYRAWSCAPVKVSRNINGLKVDFLVLFFPFADCLGDGVYLETASNPKEGKMYIALFHDLNRHNLAHEIRHALDAVQDVLKGTKLTLPESILYTNNNALDFQRFIYQMTETEMNAYLQNSASEFAEYFRVMATERKYQSGRFEPLGLSKDKLDKVKQMVLSSNFNSLDFYMPMPRFMTYKETIMKNSKTLKHYIFYNDLIDGGVIPSYETLCKAELLQRSEHRRDLDKTDYILSSLFKRVGWDYDSYQKNASRFDDPLEAFENLGLEEKLYRKLNKIYMHQYANYQKVLLDVINEIEEEIVL